MNTEIAQISEATLLKQENSAYRQAARRGDIAFIISLNMGVLTAVLPLDDFWNGFWWGIMAMTSVWSALYCWALHTLDPIRWRGPRRQLYQDMRAG